MPSRDPSGPVLALGLTTFVEEYATLRHYLLRSIGALAVLGTLVAGGSAVSAHRSASSAPRAVAGGDAFQRMLARSRDLGPLSPTRQVSLLLLLRSRSDRREAADLAAMYDPHSPRFGQFATLKQVEAYGPRAADVARVQATLRRLGLTAHWARGDSWLSVEGTVRRMERAFGVRVHRYRGPSGREFVASARDPRVPGSLRPTVTGTSHLESYGYTLGPHDVPDSGLTPTDLLGAYDIAPLRAAGLDGSGQTVVFPEIDGYRQSDFDSYTKRFHLPPMHPVLKAGPQLSPGGEAPMDMEVVHAIAPKARLLVYNMDQSSIGNGPNAAGKFLDVLSTFQRKIVNENPQAIVSNSIGSCANVLGRGAVTALKGIYDRADALGESWFAASGDQGAYDCLQALEQAGDPPSSRDIGVDMPASAPGVTGVGGTRLSVRTDRSWYAEQTWEGPADTSGSGGGFSTYFSRPSWQTAKGVGNAAYDRKGMREVPDVSAVADAATSGVYIIGGSATREGGTSQAAPIWAGIMALVDQYLQKHGAHTVGFANPALYALARAPKPYPPFHDVTVGSNLAYNATAGYDMATGLGSTDAWNLARDLLEYEKGGKR